MRFSKRLIAVLIVVVLALTFGACSGSSSEDKVTLLVQGNIDSLYLDKTTDAYLKLIDSSAEECHRDYVDGIDAEVDYFAYYCDIENFTDEMRSEVADIYRQVYSHSLFTVDKATKMDDTTYAAKVHIQPIDVMQRMSDNWDEAIAPVQQEFGGMDMNDDEVYAAYDEAWARTAIDLFREQAQQLGHMDEQTIIVRVEKNSDDAWMILDEDLQAIDNLIIYYP